MSLPATKRIAILGGGTNCYISNHFAVSAPAYGQTAIQLAEIFREHPENKMAVDLILTKMADPYNPTAPDTPEDVEAIVDKLIADPATRVIVFNVAMVDYQPEQLTLVDKNDEEQNIYDFGKYNRRLSSKYDITVRMTAHKKIIQKIRKERKDILLVGFKTTCGATKEEQFQKGLKLCKESSANIVFVNDVDKDRISELNTLLSFQKDTESFLQHLSELKPTMDCFKFFGSKPNPLSSYLPFLVDEELKIKFKELDENILSFQNNGLVTPEESSYWYNTRDEALEALVQMVLDRSHLHFTRSTVVDSETISWDSEEIPNVLRDVVNHCVAQGAYKTFTIGDSIGTKGSVGHFAYKVNETTFLTSKRKSNFNELDKIGLVKVVTDGPDHIYAYGAKPSVGGQSQRIIFDMYPHLDCILHFHSPLRQEYRNEFSIKSQFEVECGSHECGQNTAQGLNEYVLDNGQKVYAVHLDHHGPNIVFSKETDPQLVIDFIDTHWDLTRKTDGLSQENR